MLCSSSSYCTRVRQYGPTTYRYFIVLFPFLLAECLYKGRGEIIIIQAGEKNSYACEAWWGDTCYGGGIVNNTIRVTLYLPVQPGWYPGKILTIASYTTVPEIWCFFCGRSGNEPSVSWFYVVGCCYAYFMTNYTRLFYVLYWAAGMVLLALNDCLNGIWMVFFMEAVQVKQLETALVQARDVVSELAWAWLRTTYY